MPAFKNRAASEYSNKHDDAIRKELEDAGIPVLTLPSYTNGEVKTKHVGLLNGFRFIRGWRYWACMGDVPLDIAKEIYHKISELGVRAEGHASNPEPTGYCPEQDKKAKHLVEQMQAMNASTAEIIAALEKFAGNPDAPRFVSMYHIDTDEGLAALAAFIKENQVYAHNGEPGSYAASVFR